MLWKVKMSNQAKITVILILSLGILSVGLALIGVHLAHLSQRQRRNSRTNSFPS